MQPHHLAKITLVDSKGRKASFQFINTGVNLSNQMFLKRLLSYAQLPDATSKFSLPYSDAKKNDGVYIKRWTHLHAGYSSDRLRLVVSNIRNVLSSTACRPCHPILASDTDLYSLNAFTHKYAQRLAQSSYWERSLW